MKVNDGHGGEAIVVTVGFGLGTPGISVTGQFQETSADTIQDLEGFASTAGVSGSYKLPIGVGVEYTQVKMPGGSIWQGKTTMLGYTSPEAHGLLEHTWVIETEPDSAVIIEEDSPHPPDDYEFDWWESDWWGWDYGFEEWWGWFWDW